MLRRNLLPSSFGRFSSAACFALPLLQQNFAFASTKSKAVVKETRKQYRKNENTILNDIDENALISRAKSCFSDTFHDHLRKSARARRSWIFSKKIARRMCSPNNSAYILKAISVFLSLPYSATTKDTDLSRIRWLFPGDFSSLDANLLGAASTALDKKKIAEAPSRKEVTPLSVSQMKNLIGNTKIASPLDRTIFQCWVLGCKVSDLHRQQRVFLPNHNLALIAQERKKSRAFLRFVPSTEEQFERVWKTSEPKTSKDSFLQRLSKYLSKQLKTHFFTSASISEGSTKFLVGRGVSEKEVAKITGRGSVPFNLCVQSSVNPRRADAREQTKNITKLIKAIFPDGKY